MIKTAQTLQEVRELIQDHRGQTVTDMFYDGGMLRIIFRDGKRLSIPVFTNHAIIGDSADGKGGWE